MNSDLFKQYKWQNIIIAVIYILFGIVLAIFPTTAVKKTLGYMLGGVMIFVGAVKILLYMKENHQDNYYTNDLMIGIIVVVVGVFVVFKIEVLFYPLFHFYLGY